MDVVGDRLLSLPPGAAPPLESAPLVANGKLGLLPTVSSERGLDTARSVLAVPSSAGYGQVDEGFHFCHLRFSDTPVADVEHGLLSNASDPSASYSLDMSTATLRVPLQVARVSDGLVLCTVRHALRALRHMPNFALQTVEITAGAGAFSPSSQGALQVLHELRADPALLSATFDSTVVNTDAHSTYMLTGRARTVRDKNVHAACAYLIEEPDLVRCHGYNVYRADPSACFTKLRLLPPADLSQPHTYTIHVLTGVMSDDDSASPAEQLRRAILGHLSKFPPDAPASAIAASLVERHAAAWADLWISDVAFDPKQGMTDPDEIRSAARWSRTLRYAMFNLLSSARPGSLVDLGGTVAAGAGDAWITPAMLLLNTEAGRGALDARHAELPEASRAAEAHGFRGAKFAFHDDGGDLWDADAPLRLFNGCLAALNAWNYYRITLDRDWLQDRGYPVLRGVADLVCSVASPLAPGSAVYVLHNVKGMDDSASPATDNALTVVCAKNALRCAAEAAYELAFYPKQSWLSVRHGLQVPFYPATDVIAISRDAPQAATVSVLEPLMITSPYVNTAAFGDETGVALPGALERNTAFWTARLSADAAPTPLNALLEAQAVAMAARFDANKITAFDAIVAACLDAHAEPGWGNLLPAPVASATATAAASSMRANPVLHNDLNTSAMLLMIVMQGLGGLIVSGGVTETRFYYSEMMVAAVMNAALPVTWERLHIRGIGSGRKDFAVVNHILFPTAPLDYSTIAPWSVDYLSM